MNERIIRKTVKTQEVTDEEIAKEPFLTHILEKAQGKTKTLFQQQDLEEEIIEKPTTIISSNRNNVTVETEKTFDEYCREIYQWSVRLSNEQEADFKFIVPKPEWMQLYSRLRMAQGNLIKVVGPQGSGKTTLSNWLYAGLRSPHRDSEGTLLDPEAVKVRMSKGYEAFGYFKKLPGFQIINIYDEKEKVPASKEWIWNFEDSLKHLIVDLWDYSKNSRRDITKALDAIQDYWSYRCGSHKTSGTPLLNIVVFLQKEALPLHFFLGKMEYFEIKPWKPIELIDCYQHIFGSYDPFTKEVLMEIAYLSRGIFRNFKKYISNCLTVLFNKHLSKITGENVKNIITTQRIVEDMELQLSELFPHSKKNREYAVTVLRFLREYGQTQQKVLTKQFFENKMSCSRVLNALALYGYLESIEEGRERFWKVKSEKSP